MTVPLILLRMISGMESGIKRWCWLFCQLITMMKRPSPEIAFHLTWARGTKSHVRIDNFKLSKIAMKTFDVVMSVMIIAMAKTIAIARGSNEINGRMS